MKYTIVGAGAIGGTLGAYLIKAGLEVEYVDLVQEHIDAINKNGMKIDGFEGTFTVPARAMRPDEVEGPLECVLLATKAMATEAATRSIADKIADDGFVVSVQNGLNEPVISRIVGESRTVGCFINFSSDYIGPGEIKYGGPGAFVVGEIDGTISDRVRALQQDISNFMEVKTSDNIFGYLWGKLAYGSILKAGALTDLTMADSIDGYRELMVDIAREVLTVCKAEGITPMGFDGFEPGLYMTGNWPTIDRSLDRLVELRRRDKKTHSGIWRDLAVRKRPTEVHDQLAPVFAAAVKHGIEVRRLRALDRMIYEIESGERERSEGNLHELHEIATVDGSEQEND